MVAEFEMCVLEPTFEEVLTAPEECIEYTKFNMVGLSRIKISHDVIALCVLRKLGYNVTGLYIVPEFTRYS